MIMKNMSDYIQRTKYKTWEMTNISKKQGMGFIPNTAACKS